MKHIFTQHLRTFADNDLENDEFDISDRFGIFSGKNHMSSYTSSGS